MQKRNIAQHTLNKKLKPWLKHIEERNTLSSIAKNTPFLATLKVPCGKNTSTLQSYIMIFYQIEKSLVLKASKIYSLPEFCISTLVTYITFILYFYLVCFQFFFFFFVPDFFNDFQLHSNLDSFTISTFF